MKKKLINLTLRYVLIFAVLSAGIMHSPSVSAANVNDVMTPPVGWGTPTAPILALIDAGGEASSLLQTDTTVALRNAPSLSFNPDLDALALAGGTDDTVHEAGAFSISSTLNTCPVDTPVNIIVGPSVSTTVAMTGTIPNPGSNNTSHALFDLSGPSVPYLSVSDNDNIGDVFNHPGGSYSTTFGNLSNVYMIANFEAVEAAVTNAPNGSEASNTESIPSITLAYDDAGCTPINTVVNNSTANSPNSVDSLASTGQRIYMYVALAAFLIITSLALLIRRIRSAK
jgi:hypothetical protein